MAKNICCVCGKTLGIFSDKIMLKDGALCAKCLKLGGLSSIEAPENLCADRVSSAIKKKTNSVRAFSPDRNDGVIEIDTRTCLFKVEGNYFFFNELVSYKYNEFPSNANVQGRDQSSSGAAIGSVIGGLSGGLIGGAVGAAVGGKIGSFFSSPCEYMNISFVLTNPLKSNYRLEFISQKTSLSSDEYKRAYQKANECLETLQIIDRYNQESRQHNLVMKSHAEKTSEEKNVFIQKEHLSASQVEEELTVYRRMWASDVITKEEYEEKKKQLLSLK